MNTANIYPEGQEATVIPSNAIHSLAQKICDCFRNIFSKEGVNAGSDNPFSLTPEARVALDDLGVQMSIPTQGQADINSLVRKMEGDIQGMRA